MVVQNSIFFYLDLRVLGTKLYIRPHQPHAAFHDLLSTFWGHAQIYADGSKDGAAVVAATVANGKVQFQGLHHHASIFSAETTATLMALGVARKSPQHKSLIITDSLSRLKSIKNKDLLHLLCKRWKKFIN